MRNLIEQVFSNGLRQLAVTAKQTEAGKQGILRAGNSGIFIKEANKVIGSCPRLAKLRNDGVELPDGDKVARELMFQAGRANEDQWDIVMKTGWPGIIKREEETPINWTTRSGHAVSGRPDMVLCRADGTPQIGLELKLVSAIWTARDVLFESRPKFAHLCQAGHYSMSLQIPFQLWYTNRTDFATNDMVNRLCPKMGEDDSQYVEYAAYKKVIAKTSGNAYGKRISWEEYYQNESNKAEYYAAPLKILPFNIGYHIEWNNQGYLSYVRTDRDQDTPTITAITRDRIREFYELVASTETGPRPLTVKGDGSDAGYSMCDYCPLSQVCDSSKAKGNYSKWKQEVEQFLTSLENPT